MDKNLLSKQNKKNNNKRLFEFHQSGCTGGGKSVIHFLYAISLM